MNRLYAFESMPTSTGSRADHRLPLRPSQIENVAWSLAAAVGVRIARPAGADPVASGTNLDVVEKWIAAVSKDLLARRGAGLVIAGEGQPPAVHALAHAMNEALGNAGRTVIYTDPVEGEAADQIKSLSDLATDMSAGRVDLLVIVGGNPVYTAPADFKFAEALDKVTLRVHLSLHDDETSEWCQWHVPEAHFLEAWSDARGHDGTVTIIQPLIAPLYGGKSAHELLAAMSDRPERSGYDIVREFWATRRVAADAPLRNRRPPRETAARPPESTATLTPEFEQEWRRWLHDGVMPNTALPPKVVRVAVESAVSASNGDVRQSGNQLQERSIDSRRPICEQRLAAGTSEADYEADVGQRRAGEPRHSQSARLQQRTVVPRRRARTDHQPGRRVTTCRTLRSRRRVPGRRPSRQLRHRSPRVRAHSGRQPRQRAWLQCQLDSDVQCAVVRRWARSCRHRLHLLARVHAVSPPDGGARNGSRSYARRLHARPEIRSCTARKPCPGRSRLPGRQVRRLQVGHGDRPQCLHRLQCLRRRLPGREQHSGGRQGAGPARPRDALAARRQLLPRLVWRIRKPISSPCPACTARTRRARSSVRSAPRCTAPRD